VKVLVIGSGAREHALAWKLAQSPHVTEIYAAPGSDGMSRVAMPVNIKVADLNGLAQFAREKKIDLTVVGPEDPLVDGSVDLFQRKKLRIYGPSQKAARLEGSKAYAKDVMSRHGDDGDSGARDAGGGARVAVSGNGVRRLRPGVSLHQVREVAES
jgi:phosphoribosylamine--glycine ligase